MKNRLKRKTEYAKKYAKEIKELLRIIETTEKNQFILDMYNVLNSGSRVFTEKMHNSVLKIINSPQYDSVKQIEAKKRAVYLIIPTLVIGLTLVVTYANSINITRIVGVLLLVIGVIRFSSKLQALLASMVKKNIQMYYAIIGIVHGISNMGGGPLSILMSTIYSKKEIIRANVAFIYLILAIFQLVVLSIISNTSVKSEVMWLIPISFVSYMVTSKFISSIVNDKKYTFILNVMIMTYGVLAVLKQG